MKDVTGYFKDGEREKIYNSADSLRDKVLIRLLWVSGRRIKEVLFVRVADIDFQLSKIAFHIEKKKHDLVRLKPIDKFTMDLLKHYISTNELRSNDFVLKSEYNEGQPISRQRAFQIIRKSCAAAGVTRVGNKEPHPHHFRHSFAIDMAKRMKTPADIRKLQLLLDHEDLGTTEQYLQFADEEVSELIESAYE